MLSKKQLAVLCAVAGLLLVALLVQKILSPEPSLREELRLEALAPEDFRTLDASRLEIYRGSREDDKVVLAREGGAWFVATRYNAPANETKVGEFLKKIKNLQGELRSDEEAVLEDFRLTDENALHVAVYREGSEETWSHLLVGRQETFGRSFLRRAGESRVFAGNANLATEAGIRDEEADKSPESSPWVEKTVADLEKDQITRIALATPDYTYVFEKRATESAPQPDEAEAPQVAEASWEWVLAEGGRKKTFKQSGVDGIVDRFDLLTATDVEDPARTAELGLAEPRYRCSVALADGSETVLLAAAPEEENGDAYLQAEGRDTIYRIQWWQFEKLFPEPENLFE
ncbi:MAG: DUF4340 domain-containing protein [Acidobacteriota bacterium]|nr:MAG: DUF4340 domain-containing protein [Acidobacteriota bacterium]